MSGMRTDVCVVLVEPSHPGNVGSVSRAMNNMGVTDLRLVNPCDHRDTQARSMAVNSTGILDHARVYSSLADAVADRQLVIGSSARLRTRQAEMTRLWDISTLLPNANGKIALVFGRESSGLTNDEMSICNGWVYIPTFGDSGSLNLSHAVMVTLYELSKTLAAAASPATPDPLAQSREVEGMKRHFFQLLKEIDFLRPNQAPIIWSSFADLIGRLRLTKLDVRLMRGFFHRIEVTLRLSRRRDRSS